MLINGSAPPLYSPAVYPFAVAPVPPESAVARPGPHPEWSPIPSKTGAAERNTRLEKQMGRTECQTCKERKYQDQSGDPGVSMKTPTHLAPEQAAGAVRAHENEHVNREQLKAREENREVVAQEVQIHSSLCPECGRPYVSGGTTKTITRSKSEPSSPRPDQAGQMIDQFA